MNLLYFVGAGRSGTTILAAMLGAHDKISWLGELTRLAQWQNSSTSCSCGQSVKDCDAWHSRGVATSLGPAMAAASQCENHANVLPTIIGLRRFAYDYCRQQVAALRRASDNHGWLLDSSKYTARALGLVQCKGINAKFIYLVRDPRGVVHSFNKDVQFRRTTISACIYYVAINLLAQLAVWTVLKGKTLKIRYEDLATDPEAVIESVGDFLNLDLSDISQMAIAEAKFSVDHIVGGNRWAAQGAVRFHPDIEWREKMGRGRRVLVYLICLPFQLINRYGI